MTAPERGNFVSDSRQYSVAVLMSSYNGEKYLREQLDSILNQKDVDVHLHIRDDGSTDATLDIIREYIAANPGKISLTTGENLGPGRSFMELLYNAPDTYDYYAFSDQDDVWLDDKLIAGIRVLKGRQKEVYAGNLMCVDKDLNEIGLQNPNPRLDFSPYSLMILNKGTGCTIIFSARIHALLKEEARRPHAPFPTTRLHDAWVCLAGAVLEVLEYDPEYHILYRQHGGNALGTETYDSAWRRFCRSIQSKAIRLRDKSKRNLRSRTAREILRAFPECANRFPYLKIYAEAGKPGNKIKLIRSYGEYKEHGGFQTFPGFCLYVLFNLI